MYMYKKDLALNNLQWLICHKTKPNPTKAIQWLFHQLKLFVNSSFDVVWSCNTIFLWNLSKRMLSENVYPTPPLQIGYERQLILKWSTAGLNPEFIIGYCTKSKKPNLPYYFVGRRREGFMSFFKGISAKWRSNNSVQDLNLGSLCPFLLWVLSGSWSSVYGRCCICTNLSLVWKHFIQKVSRMASYKKQ